MANLTTLKAQIETANALGRANLNNKGVTTNGTETTYQLMSKIKDVTGGGECNVNHEELYNNGYAEGETSGYNKGYNVGKTDGYSEGEINGYKNGYEVGETEGYSKGYADGQGNSSGEQYNAPNPLEYATSLNGAYWGATFPTGHEITLTVPRVTNFTGAFRETDGIEKVVLKGSDNGNVVSFEGMFRNCKSIKVLDLTEFVAKISDAYMMFYSVSTLIKILGEIDFSESTNNNGFAQCDNLEEIYPKANSIKSSISFAKSKNLIATSVQAIFDGLATVETVQTLTLNTTQKVLQSHVDSANSKGWTVVGGTVVQEVW